MNVKRKYVGVRIPSTKVFSGHVAKEIFVVKGKFILIDISKVTNDLIFCKWFELFNSIP